MCVAVSGIEMALWDLVGRIVNTPLCTLLGGATRTEIPVYATIAAGVDDWSSDGIAAEAQRCVDAGFESVKIVPMRGCDLSQAAWLATATQRIAAVRDVLGPARKLLVECAFSLSPVQLLQLVRAVEEFDCFWFEAPLVADDPSLFLELRRAANFRIASGEAMHGRRAYRNVIERQAVDVIQPDVKWVGGVLEAKKIAAWAEAYQIKVAPHNNSGEIGTAVSAHLAATLPNLEMLELPSRRVGWEEELTGRPLLGRNGTIMIDDLERQCGSGVRFDESVARGVAMVSGAINQP